MRRQPKAPAPPAPTAIDLAAFRRLDPARQIAQIRGQKVERTFEIDRQSIDKDKRTVWLSIASERPYERWWGIEILDHRRESIRAERLESGAPLLVGHDTADQVGVVENFEIASDRKLRVLARFGKSARAEEIWQDVLDDIRRNTSVGYLIHDLVLEKSEEGVNTYRVTDWEPLEGSLVAVPADPSVGVGRDYDPAHPAPYSHPKETIMTDEERKQKEAEERAKREAEAKEAAAVAAAVQRETDRVNGILAAGAEFRDLGGEEIARELIKDRNASAETFKARMADKLRGTHKPTQTAAPGTPGYGSGARHVIMRGGQLRAFMQPLRFDDGSQMEPLESAYRAGQWLLAVVGGSQRAQKWCREHGLDIQQRIMQGGVDTLGGYLVPTEMEQAIIDMRESYGLARRLARRRPMGSDTRSIPKRTGGVTAYFIEEDNSGITASEKAWGNVNLIAKTLAALTKVSENLEEDSIIDVVDDLAMEMAWAFAQKEDQCWLIGDGTSTYGGMTGLVTLFNASALSSRFNAVTNHDTMAEYDNVDLTGVLASVADFAGLNPSWVCSRVFAEMVFGRLKAVAGGVTGQGLEARQRMAYLGYPVDTSDIMNKDATGDQSDTTVALFGDFSMSSSFGDRRGITIQVLRERYADQLQIGIRAHERFQIVNHDVGSTAVKGPVAALYAD